MKDAYLLSINGGELMGSYHSIGLFTTYAKAEKHIKRKIRKDNYGYSYLIEKIEWNNPFVS